MSKDSDILFRNELRRFLAESLSITIDSDKERIYTTLSVREEDDNWTIISSDSIRLVHLTGDIHDLSIPIKSTTGIL